MADDLVIKAKLDPSGARQGAKEVEGALSGIQSAGARLSGAMRTAVGGFGLAAAISAAARLKAKFDDLVQTRLDEVFSNVKSLADRAADSFKALDARLERTERHLRAVADLAAAGADFKLRLDLAAIERDRQSKLDALDPNADDYSYRAGEINREADKNAIYARYYAAKGALGKETQAEIDANGRERDAVKARMEAVKRQMALNGSMIEMLDDNGSVMDNPFEWVARGFTRVSRTKAAGKYAAENDKLFEEFKGLAEKLRDLNQAEKDLKAKRDLETGQGGQALYEELQAALEKIGVAARMDFRKEHDAPEKEEKEKERRGSRAGYLSDSLARIGGYVGAAATDRTAEKAQRERENQTRVLQAIERNTRNSTAVLA